jgi:hypothetical protein
MDNLVVKTCEILEVARAKYRRQISMLHAWILENQTPELLSIVTEVRGEQGEAERDNDGDVGPRGLDASVQSAF